MKRPLCVLLVLAACASPPEPLPGAHSHNDYLQARPLRAALELGFGSVEADVHLVGDALLVAHTRAECRSERTLEALYLDPLTELARAGRGRILSRSERPLVLLVDVKSDAEATWRALAPRLAARGDVFSSCVAGVVTERAVTVVLSGASPRATLVAARERFAFLDGRLADLEANPPAPTSLVPLVSASWLETIGWLGIGAFPDEARAKLAGLVARAHERRYRLRFWATPDRPVVWQLLRSAGVDVIGFDHLRLGADFLRGRPG